MSSLWLSLSLLHSATTVTGRPWLMTLVAVWCVCTSPSLPQEVPGMLSCALPLYLLPL
jgi:hypothetical protein